MEFNLNETETAEKVEEVSETKTEQSGKNKPKSAANTEVIETSENKEKTPESNYVYVGPSAPGGALLCNKNIQGSRKDAEELLAELIEKYPTIKKLIVPISKLAESKIKIRSADTLLGKYYNELKSEFAKSANSDNNSKGEE